ncbi:DinB family protein [Gracilimonas mengyeensis]|uniref:DinB superfamily protein n=1 Tax=Gracilimonas mengyeensis TaxID=1302730 RepID=A0A521F6G0_9BACT|nr:DinB family protein [Gracilimonas mengyeensis]SMO91727.1 DinB superfamily protein [Gracilimonas mengyeensis]
MSVWDKEYPSKSEYAHFYADYIANVPKANIIESLNSQMHEMYTFINAIPGDKAFYTYEKGKWTIKQIIGHIIETERVFGFRGLAFSRRDPNPLPDMDQDRYVKFTNHNSRTIQNLANEYLAVRISTIHLFQNMTKEMISLKGTASGFEFTVRSIPFIIAGHELHHKEIIRTKYL